MQKLTSKPFTIQTATARKQLWTNIPEKSQAKISGGISMKYKHIHRLQEEFAAELATLRGRVD